ncbi:MAG: DUF6266 family protein [Pedobacter sp.]
MGKLINGPQGQVIGSVGNNISYILNGQNVLKMKRTKEIKFEDLSFLQKVNCQRMAVTANFLNSIQPLLKAGYGQKAHGTRLNYHNLATSYHKLHALKGEYPSIEIDYLKVQISTGDLPMPLVNTAIPDAAGIIINWTYNVEDSTVSGFDQTMILLHYPEFEESISFFYGIERRIKTQLVELPDPYRTSRAEVYLSFVSADRTLVATSKYLGRLN